MSLLVKAGVKTFVLLEDTPSSFSGEAEKGLRVNAGETALELVTRVLTFLGLSDTPSSYSAQAGKGLQVNTGETALELVDQLPYEATREGGLEFVIDGGGAEIATGEHGHLVVPYDCTITEVQMEADQSGSIKVDIWKDDYDHFPPADGDTICGGNEPELSGAQKYRDATLTSWTTTLSKGDILAYYVDSITTIERCSVVLLVNKT